MRQPRRDPLLPPTPSPAAFILLMHLVLAGCTAERAGIPKGDSGPIAWEVTDIRQSLEEQGNRMRWHSDRESGAGTLRTSGDGRVRLESSAGRRGSLTLYEGHGRRWMTIDYDGLDGKGELVPAE